MTNEPETYSLQEAAEILGVSRQTLNRHAEAGEIPAIRLGQRWLLPRRYVDDLFAGVGYPRQEAASA